MSDVIFEGGISRSLLTRDTSGRGSKNDQFSVTALLVLIIYPPQCNPRLWLVWLFNSRFFALRQREAKRKRNLQKIHPVAHSRRRRQRALIVAKLEWRPEVCLRTISGNKIDWLIDLTCWQALQHSRSVTDSKNSKNAEEHLSLNCC